MRHRLLIAIVAASGWALVPPGALAADASRGRVLYEYRCAGCHDQSVHGRAHREARDMPSLRGWVRRWSANLGLGWTEGDVADVAAHLNARYYRFACPPADCNATSRRDDGRGRLALDARPR